MLYDVIVVGSGISGLYAALYAKKAGFNVAVLTKGNPFRSNSAVASGGINAVINVAEYDSVARHVSDTVEGADGLSHIQNIEKMCEEAPNIVRELRQLGVGFDEDEEGNLWIAIGDVSGHGYQCAIAQAMTKASLTSLVSAEHKPSALLSRIDKVLRRGGSARTFTSLALAKIDVATGNVTLSNAGNPYPVHVTVDGRTCEIEIPSLPLGMGPPRTYEDVELHIGDRDYLLFYSDGLVEVRNRDDVMLGFEKPASIVRMRRGQSSAEIVSGLEKAWQLLQSYFLSLTCFSWMTEKLLFSFLPWHCEHTVDASALSW